MTSGELELPVEPVAVPRARDFVVHALASLPEEVLEDAKLVVTELVTNALLHGEAPRTVRLVDQDGLVRIEVQDASRILPVIPRQNLEAMTGRGLGLVAALSDTWGVEPVSGGKVVWASVRAVGSGPTHDDLLPEIDVDALLASWTDEPDPEPLFTVRLGAVPTSLLLAAKSHIDNVVREFELVKTDHERAGIASNGVPSRLIESVTRSFATARTDIKRQAVEAAARGDAETDLVLRLPFSAADAGEEYLEALDEADRYARAARLLTLEAPPVHQLFRRWYVQSLVNQIRAQASGQTGDDPPTLLQVLSDEVAELAALRASWERLQLLQKVTAELTGATSLEDIATTVVDNAVEFLGAISGRVYLLHDDNTLRSLATRGGSGEWVQNYEEIDMDRDLPGPHVVKTGKALFLRSMAEIEERYPELAKVYDRDRCLHVTPLTIGEHRLGAFTLTFPGDVRLDEETQLSFVRALADALAQALERALALAKAALAQERLSFLADASVALSSSIDYEETLDAVGDLLVPRLADWCVIQVLGHDNALETVGLRHFDPEREEWALRMRDRYPVQMDASTGAPNVIRTGVSEVYPEIPEELVEASAIDAEHLAIIRQVPLRSAVVVPLDGRRGRFGAITLIYAESGRHYDDTDVPFVEDVARRAALALETAESFREQSGRLADVTKVAVAAQRAILAAPPSQVGPIALSARYVSAAAEALVGGDLYEIVPRPGMVRLLIGDVRGKGLSAVRTATVVLGEFRASAADLDDLSVVARQIDRRLRPYLGDEDFVTALLAEIHDDGTFAVAACGHPPALLAADGSVTPIQNTATLPLGLGSDPVLSTGRLTAGDRILLYTDGLIEARSASGEFLDVATLTAQLADGPLDEVLDEVLGRLHAAVGPELGDDLALVVAEYTG